MGRKEEDQKESVRKQSGDERSKRKYLNKRGGEDLRERRKRKIRRKADGKNCGMKGGRGSTLTKGEGKS